MHLSYPQSKLANMSESHSSNLKNNEAMPLPPGAPLGQVNVSATSSQGKVAIPPPPSFARQMAQLVVIPAIIVIVAVGVALLFGKIAGASDTLDSQILKLKQSSGAGKMAYNLQDPRYKDRSLAAYNIATMIPSVKDADKAKVSDALVEILRENVGDHEDALQAYLLMAIGRLGQPKGFEAIVERLSSPLPRIREGAISGILAWPNKEQARNAVSRLTVLLSDDTPIVRAKSAAALGELAPRGDATIIAALHEAMTAQGLEQREAVWNSAIALARLGDEQGAQYVADLLLNREYLASQPELLEGPQHPMSPGTQDRVILSVLAAARTMPSQIVRDKIRQIVEKDPSRVIRAAAHRILSEDGAKVNETPAQP